MTTQCKICGERFATHYEAQNHLWGQHPGFLRKPVVTGVQQAVKMGITKSHKEEQEVVRTPGTLWGFTRR